MFVQSVALSLLCSKQVTALHNYSDKDRLGKLSTLNGVLAALLRNFAKGRGGMPPTMKPTATTTKI